MPEHRPMLRLDEDGLMTEVGRYHRRKLTLAEQVQRAAARRVIIQTANGWMAQRLGLAPYGRRQIQQAVCLVRHRRLVDDRTLALAGYGSAR